MRLSDSLSEFTFLLCRYIKIEFDWNLYYDTDLVSHYMKELGAKMIDWHTLYIDSYSAIALINKYFKEGWMIWS